MHRLCCALLVLLVALLIGGALLYSCGRGSRYYYRQCCGGGSPRYRQCGGAPRYRQCGGGPRYRQRRPLSGGACAYRPLADRYSYTLNDDKCPCQCPDFRGDGTYQYHCPGGFCGGARTISAY